MGTFEKSADRGGVLPGSETEPEDQAPAMPLRQGEMLVSALIDAYMGAYTGRDTTRVQRLTWWRARVGSIALQDLSDDHVHAALEQLADQTGRVYSGKDADDRPILRSKHKVLRPATINRYHAALGAVVTWAIRRRIAPRGFVHPCRSVERRPEDNSRTRFLSHEEIKRLLAACRASTWPRLHLLVSMALVTGARKSELLGLHWRDIDLERGEATLGRTKNDAPRVLPLTPGVVAELAEIRAGASSLVFPGTRYPDRPFSVNGPFGRALVAAGIRGVSFHVLRHSCASLLARSGASLLEIGDVLGHKTASMTRRYSHLATSHKAALVTRVLGDLE